MDSTPKLFREYILWRSRMTVYAAFFLVVLMVGGLVALLVSSPSNVNRFGLLLQLLGVLALAPDIIGKQNLPILHEEPQKTPVENAGANSPPPLAEPAPAPRDEQPFVFYQVHNLTYVLGNILASLALMWLLVDKVLFPRADIFPNESMWRVLFSLLGFIWLNVFMILLIGRLRSGTLPNGPLAWFFFIDLVVGILGLFFAGFVHILLRWVRGGLEYIFQNGSRRVMLIVTLPFFVAGLFFELVATFL